MGSAKVGIKMTIVTIIEVVQSRNEYHLPVIIIFIEQSSKKFNGVGGSIE